MRRAGLVLSFLSALIAAASVALANGTAQPDSVAFMADADAAGDFAMNTTFGFLFTNDSGASWEWTCHEAVIGSAPFTPATHRAPDGALYVTVPLLLGNDPSITLWRSADGGCSWTGNESLRSETVRALAFRPGDDSTVIAAGGRSGDIAAVWRSTDGGVVFGAPVLEAPNEVFLTVHYAPSDPQRVYVASQRSDILASTVWRSTNGGTVWTPFDFPFVDQPPIRVLAVDPLDADVVWLRNDAATDRVFRSTNGGVSFALAHSVGADVQGMALTGGGATWWLALAQENGILRATAAAPAFTAIPGSPIARCVEAEGDTLFTCANPYLDPYSAAVTTDGATFDTAMSFQRIGGPVQGCAADSDHVTVCEPLWPIVRANLGLDPTPTPTPDGDGGDGGGGCACSLGEYPTGKSGIRGALAIVLLVVLGTRRGRL